MSRRRMAPRPIAALVAGLVSACGGPLPPPSPPAVAPTAPPEPALEESLPPDVVRCGIDDAPVPIGDRSEQPDRRFALLGQPVGLVAMAEPSPARPALPTVALSARADGIALAPTALAELFQPCGEQAQPDDAGEITVTVGFGASGAPRTSRADHGARATGPGPSPFARCLAERACRLPVSPAHAGKSLSARIGTTLSAPVFRGRVEAYVSFVPTKPGPRDQFPSKAVQTRMNAIQKLLEIAGDVCAKRLPPADSVFLQATVELAAGKPRAFSFNPSIDHGEVLRACAEASLATSFAELEAAPKMDALLNLSLQLLTEPSQLPGAVD